MGGASTSANGRSRLDSLPGLLCFLQFLIGVWLLVGHWIIGYPISEATLDAQLNQSMVGILVVLTAIPLLRRPVHRWWLNLINLAAGVWLLLAPFVVGYGRDPEGGDRMLVNDVVCGALLALLSVAAMVLGTSLRSRRAKRARRAPAER